jgi:hypothetical protein
MNEMIADLQDVARDFFCMSKHFFEKRHALAARLAP